MTHARENCILLYFTTTLTNKRKPFHRNIFPRNNVQYIRRGGFIGEWVLNTFAPIIQISLRLWQALITGVTCLCVNIFIYWAVHLTDVNTHQSSSQKALTLL